MTAEQTMLFKRLIQHAHKLAMNGNGEIAQDIRLCLLDASRYWYLRGDVREASKRWSCWRIEHWVSPSWEDVRGKDLDQMIDAARQLAIDKSGISPDNLSMVLAEYLKRKRENEDHQNHSLAEHDAPGDE